MSEHYAGAQPIAPQEIERQPAEPEQPPVREPHTPDPRIIEEIARHHDDLIRYGWDDARLAELAELLEPDESISAISVDEVRISAPGRDNIRGFRRWAAPLLLLGWFFLAATYNNLGEITSIAHVGGFAKLSDCQNAMAEVLFSGSAFAAGFVASGCYLEEPVR